ncbi:MAG TPA: hypothetical protein PLD48_09805 [Bacillota bacterium]|nr:hypothetical protein [Bacillota bacterium]HOK69780.1 hypothetical protein [Bacillota bacterium]HPP86008.1 hypothetical protein [Bacillota bacterium]
MRTIKNWLNLSLFLFDGSAATTATAAGEASGTAEGVTAQYAAAQSGEKQVTQTPAAEIQEQPESKEQLEAEFEKLINGKYREFYKERTSKIVQERLKDYKDKSAKLDSYQPIIEAALKRFGAKDLDELQKAMYIDNGNLEQEALEKGISVEQLKRIREQEYENMRKDQELQRLKAEKERIEAEKRAEAERQKMYESWQKDESAIQKELDPNFSLLNAIQNPEFADLLNRGVSVMRAYKAVYYDDHIAKIAKYARDKGMKDAADTIKANGQRPSENLSSANAPVAVIQDPRKYTDDYWEQIDREVRSGKVIKIR